jgi:hypothetical protein
MLDHGYPKYDLHVKWSLRNYLIVAHKPACVFSNLYLCKCNNQGIQKLQNAVNEMPTNSNVMHYILHWAQFASLVLCKVGSVIVHRQVVLTQSTVYCRCTVDT